MKYKCSNTVFMVHAVLNIIRHMGSTRLKQNTKNLWYPVTRTPVKAILLLIKMLAVSFLPVFAPSLTVNHLLPYNSMGFKT